MQQLIDDGRAQGADPLLVGFRQMIQPAQRLVQFLRADGFSPLPQRRDDRCHRPLAVPGPKLPDFLLDDGLDLVHLLPPLADGRVDDAVEVVDVVHDGARQFLYRRVHVPGHGQVDEVQHPAPPALQHRPHHVRTDEGFRGPRRADDDVRGLKSRGELLQRQAGPAVSFGQLAGAGLCPVGHPHPGMSLPGQMAGHQLRHFPGADQQDFFVEQGRRNPVSQLHGRVADGGGTLADGRLRSGPLAGPQRRLKQPGHMGPRGPGLLGQLQRRAHLTEDLGFADQHGVQPGGHPRQVPGGGQAVVVIEVGSDGCARFACKSAQKSYYGFRPLRLVLARDVHFRAVAGGQNGCFRAAARADQAPEVLRHLI